MFGLSSLNNIIGASSKTAREGKEKERRRSSERRIHADRRSEPRIGDIKERRAGEERRS